MDFFAHLFWSYIIFHKLGKRSVKLAVLFGALPDLLSWGVFSLHSFTNGNVGKSHFDLMLNLPEWVSTLYGISHSIIIVIGVLIVLAIVLKKMPLYILAYPLHILMDIPTHSREFLPTPFLWPISEWKFPGFSWGVPWFMILNYTTIFCLLIYINRIKIKNLFVKEKKKKKKIN